MSEEKEKTVASLCGAAPQVLAQECVKILDEKRRRIFAFYAWRIRRF